MRTNKHKRGTHMRDRKPGGPVVVPDADIIAMRRMYQVDRKPMHIVMRAFSQYSDGYVRSVLNYVVRTQRHLCVSG